ncbi:MAG TPA: HAD family hydrolase [Candidatus Udaeobacter sp.]|nr:HAD family hydrolase [Candidatus Udaeobacter sp.]
MIKAVYFDLDDTLYDQLQPFRLAVESTGLIGHANGSLHIEDLYKRIRRHSDLLWVKHVNGEMTLEELRIERTTAAFSDIGIEVSTEAAVLLQRNYELEQSRLTLREGVQELFEQLQASGIGIGLITNGPVEHQMKKINALELLKWVAEPNAYISDGIGIAKPNPDVFHFVRRKAALRPEQLVYVGDAWHNDIAPSFQAGWTPIWLNTRKQQPHTKDGFVNYLECGSIKEVMPLLRELNERQTGCLL